MLENKVSELLAINGYLKNSNIQHKKQNEESQTNLEDMSIELDQLRTRVAVLEIDNQFLEKCLTQKEEGNHITLY